MKQKRLNRFIARSRRLICSDLSLPAENQFHLGSALAVLSFPRQTPKSRLRELLLHRLFSSSRRVFPVSRGLTEDRLPYRVSSRDGSRHEWSAVPTVARQFSRTLKIDVRKLQETRGRKTRRENPINTRDAYPANTKDCFRNETFRRCSIIHV